MPFKRITETRRISFQPCARLYLALTAVNG